MLQSNYLFHICCSFNKNHKAMTQRIELDLGKRFIQRFKQWNESTPYQIPTAWLFEKGIKEQLSINGVDGIRFYSAINNTIGSGLEDKLTLIMVPVKINLSTNIKEDLYNQELYEFSDLCPPKCSVNPSVNGTFINKYNDLIVPRSWYFSRTYFENIFAANPQSEGIRLYRDTINDVLILNIVPITLSSTDYNDLPLPQYNNVGLICTDGENCDLESELYLA